MDSSTQTQTAQRIHELRTGVRDEASAVAQRLVGRRKRWAVQRAGYARWAAAMLVGVGIASVLVACGALTDRAHQRRASTKPADVVVVPKTDTSSLLPLDSDPLKLDEPTRESTETFLRQINVLLDDPIDPRAAISPQSASSLPVSPKIIAAEVDVDAANELTNIPPGEEASAAGDANVSERSAASGAAGSASR